jgi:hypothetical protein
MTSSTSTMDGHTKLTTEDNNADSVDRSLLQHEVQCNLEYPFEDYDHGEEQYYKACHPAQGAHGVFFTGNFHR